MDGRYLIRVVLALLGAGLCLPAGAGAACGGVKRGYPAHRRAPGSAPLAVGDSVMLGAFDDLLAAGFQVDVRGCRQMGEGLGVLRARERARTLPAKVLVALGANWIVTMGEIRQALRILGRQRVLGLVTPRELNGAVTSDQANMRAAGRRWPRRVKVLDWVRYSAGHASWFSGDGLHLGPAGAAGFARLLSRAFAWSVPAFVATWRPEPAPATPERLSEVSARPAGP